MAKTLQNEYNPDTFTAPGETLLEILESIGMPQAELAKRMNRSTALVAELIEGQANLTLEIAQQLEQILGVPASFWLNYERFYRESLERPKRRSFAG